MLNQSLIDELNAKVRELLAKTPARDLETNMRAMLASTFARLDLVWVELTRDVVELAAVIRVRHGLRTPDAMQAASCIQLGADHLFLSGDSAFRRVGG